MHIPGLDRYLTTEPDNGFSDWCEHVFDNITEEEISSDEYKQNESFFDDGLNALFLAGVGDDGVSPKFAASVLKRRFRVLKFHPELTTWAEVQAYSLSI